MSILRRRAARALFTVALLLPLAAGCTGPSVRSDIAVLDDGHRIHYWAVGAGPDTVLVLHHGPALHGSYLVEALKPLAAGHTLLIYDQRGRGRSEPGRDTTELTVTGDVADLDAVRRHFGLERLTIVGHGWGAGLATLYALEHAPRVKRLLLISPMFPRDGHYWAMRLFPYESEDSLGLAGIDSARAAGQDVSDPAAFCRRFWGAYLSPAEVRDARTLRALSPSMCDAPPEALARVESVKRSLLRSLGSWDWRDRLASLDAPTLLIQGLGPRGPSDSSNTAIWRRGAREWTERLPQGAVVFLNAPAQFPWLGDRSGFNDAARVFLAGGWPREARAPRRSS